MSDPFSYRSLGTNNPEKGSLTNDILKYIDENLVPLEVTIEATLNCNLRCGHCYNFDRREISGMKKNELSTDDILHLIEDVSKEGCLNITFTGGEPLLHPGFFEAASHARNKHMGVYVKTNGTMLYGDNITKCINSRIMGIEVSFYGAFPHTHDEMTGIQGSFDKSLSGIKSAVSSGLSCRMIFILTKKNFSETKDMLNLARNAGVEFGFNPQISARYDKTNSSLDLQMDRDQLLFLYSGVLREFLPKPDPDPESSVQCGCARGVCGISAHGDVLPCVSAPLPAGNIKEKTFREIWRDSEVLNKIRVLKLDDFKKCRSCPDKPFCRRSSGFVYINTGNYTGADPWTCMEAGVIKEVLREK